ncbi:hypothetical protein [Prosthecobacter sp.]|uniref:hypothetical protein n=1 Tax=Prosthecobacter sp. TaxID=1965333 RepID=UPI003782F795
MTSIKDLPAHLKPTPGTRCLLADFQNQKAGQATVYFVNATKNLTRLQKQDGDIYCKRETKTQDGQWRRCDSHQYSWCGNSYHSVEVPAGGVISWQQKLNSAQGEERPVRFRLFSGTSEVLESNEGMGRVAEEDVTFCRYDSMAMSYGPFEDVAAVAMGEVEGSQGTSVRRNNGIDALRRFPLEKELFPVLKKVVANLRKEAESEHRGSDDESRVRFAIRDDHYQSCLRTLADAVKLSLGQEEVWPYVAGLVNDPQFPWSAVTMEWVVNNFGDEILDEKRQEKRALVESVLARPDHQALASALKVYGKVADKEEAGLRLEEISKDPHYSAEARTAAREAREKLFPNPYLQISFENGSSFAGQLPRLKSVTLVNISPQRITLPVKRAEDLISVHVRGHDELSTHASAAGAGQMKLKPGEKIVLHDVSWWRGIDPAKVGKSDHDPFAEGEEPLSFILQADTPGLWEIPAATEFSMSVHRDDLLKALEADR